MPRTLSAYFTLAHSTIQAAVKNPAAAIRYLRIPLQVRNR